MTLAPTSIPTAWNVLHQAITQRRAVRATYHDRLRVICPHALGWKNGRPKALVYQIAVLGLPPSHDPRGWRSLFVEEIQNPIITDDQWRTANNYTPNTTGIDTLATAITSTTNTVRPHQAIGSVTPTTNTTAPTRPSVGPARKDPLLPTPETGAGRAATGANHDRPPA